MPSNGTTRAPAVEIRSLDMVYGRTRISAFPRFWPSPPPPLHDKDKVYWTGIYRIYRCRENG